MFAHVPLRWQQQFDIVIFVPIVALSDIFWQNIAHMKTRRPFPRLHAYHPCSHSTVIQSMSWQTVKSIVDSLHVNELHRLPSCLERRLFYIFCWWESWITRKRSCKHLESFVVVETQILYGNICNKKTSEMHVFFSESPIISSQPPHHHTRPPPKGYCIFCRHSWPARSIQFIRDPKVGHSWWGTSDGVPRGTPLVN